MQRGVLEHVSDCVSFGCHMQICLINMRTFKEKEEAVENQLLNRFIS